ncbi:MAG: hypothetical protein ABSA51_07640, partial [Anaerolineaceae bacterium]
SLFRAALYHLSYLATFGPHISVRKVLPAKRLTANLAGHWALSLGGMPRSKTADALGPCGTLEL